MASKKARWASKMGNFSETRKRAQHCWNICNPSRTRERTTRESRRVEMCGAKVEQGVIWMDTRRDRVSSRGGRNVGCVMWE